MEIAKLFESFFECSEAYKIVDRLKQTVLNQSEKNHFFEYLVSNNVDLKIDFLRDLFQSEHGDRDKFKQDFTPDSIAQIIASQMTDSGSVADICSGTGTLLIQILNKFPDAFLHAEELSDRAIPFLLTNLAIRNAEAEVLHLDVLTKELKAVYRLSKGERFSTITVSSDEPEFRTFDFVVMNPPYSVKWTPVKSEENKAFGLAPKSYADFQFVLHGLHHLRDAAKLIAVLPHGVLFRGNGEKTVRENLIRAGLLEYVVGLPDKLFLNTSIPVCLLGLCKQNNRGILFVDASKSFKKRSKQNEMLDEHVQLVIEAIRCRNSIQGFSRLVSTNELEENDFNLNIPRYVDGLEQEEPVDFANSVRELVQIDDEIKQTEKELLRQIKELTGFSYEEAMEINKWERQLLGRSRSAPRSKEQKKGQLYSAGTILIPISGVSRNNCEVKILKTDSLVDGRYVCVNSKNYPPYFLFSVIEYSLPNFLSRYLQTINIAFEDIGRMKIKIPTDDRVIYLLDKSMQAMDENQERIENQIIELQKIKNFFLQKMFPETQTNK